METVDRATPVVDVDEAAALLKCGRTTIFNLIRNGQLDSLKVGRRTLIQTDDWTDSRATNAC